MLLSIIIPLYNCENEISQCLQSIIDNIESSGQYHNQIEVIVVNDGSTDNSFAIVRELSGKRKYLKIISQQNMGVSCARNTGMKKANGKYIWFIDADDYIAKNSISNLLKIATENDLDMLFFSHINGYSEALSNYTPTQNFNNLSEIISGKEYIGNYQYAPYAWHYILKNDFVTKTNVRFEPKRTMEDTMFTTAILLFANKIASVDAECYYYITRRNSITHSTNTAHQNKLIDDYIYVAQYLNTILKDLENGDHYIRIADRRNSFIFFTLIKVLKFAPQRIKEVVTLLRQKKLYPFNSLLSNNYPGLKYRILCFCMNRQFIWESLCRMRTLFGHKHE